MANYQVSKSFLSMFNNDVNFDFYCLAYTKERLEASIPV